MTTAPMAGWRQEELVYCSNVHPGGDLKTIIRNLHHFIAGVGRQRHISWAGAGLWLCHDVAEQLNGEVPALVRFQAALNDTGVRLFTLNGFHYGNFHADSVKAQVYRPDWSEPARKVYTLQLAAILAACMPAEITEGTISVLPIGYKPDWSPAKQDIALQHLCELAVVLAELKERSGRSIRVCLEMEPGCVLESTTEAVTLFSDSLPAAAARHGVAMDCIHAHLGICYDVCHQAVMFEDIRRSLSALRNAGIVIGKMQISNALEVAQPDAHEVRKLLGDFAEPRYLHQVRCRDDEGNLYGVMDLPEALQSDQLSRHHPWRIHFHVPLQSRQLYAGELGTTQKAIGEVLDFLRDNAADMHPHLEVETYTWRVLPESLRPEGDARLVESLKRELQWLQDELATRGLLST
jgi:sugar phosphate isomerase/epimerase